MIKRRRTLAAWLFSGFASMLVVVATAWACTGHGTGTTIALSLEPQPDSCVWTGQECPWWATGYMMDYLINPAAQTVPNPADPAGNARVDLYYSVGAAVIPDHEEHVCHDPDDPLPGTTAQTLLASGTTNPFGVFNFSFLLPDHGKQSPWPVTFCGYDGRYSKDASFTSQPVVLIY